MRDRDKLKDDAIAHLSDQLVALTARFSRKTAVTINGSINSSIQLFGSKSEKKS